MTSQNDTFGSPAKCARTTQLKCETLGEIKCSKLTYHMEFSVSPMFLGRSLYAGFAILLTAPIHIHLHHQCRQSHQGNCTTQNE